MKRRYVRATVTLALVFLGVVAHQKCSRLTAREASSITGVTPATAFACRPSGGGPMRLDFSQVDVVPERVADFVTGASAANQFVLFNELMPLVLTPVTSWWAGDLTGIPYRGSGIERMQWGRSDEAVESSTLTVQGSMAGFWLNTRDRGLRLPERAGSGRLGLGCRFDGPDRAPLFDAATDVLDVNYDLAVPRAIVAGDAATRTYFSIVVVDRACAARFGDAPCGVSFEIVNHATGAPSSGTAIVTDPRSAYPVVRVGASAATAWFDRIDDSAGYQTNPFGQRHFHFRMTRAHWRQLLIDVAARAPVEFASDPSLFDVTAFGVFAEVYDSCQVSGPRGAICTASSQLGASVSHLQVHARASVRLVDRVTTTSSVPGCFAGESRAVTRETRAFKDFDVGGRLQPRTLRAELFYPPGFDVARPRAAFAMFHGGGWASGTPATWFGPAAYFASRGAVAVSFEYRLTETPREATKDARSAVRWLKKYAADLGIDPRRIVAFGDSAGGHLALTTALVETLSDERGADAELSSVPAALALAYPVVTTVAPTRGVNLPEIDPLTLLSAHFPRSLILLPTADREPLTPPADTRRFGATVRATAGADQCRVVEYAGEDHAFLTKSQSAYRRALADFDDFVAENLDPSAVVGGAARVAAAASFCSTQTDQDVADRAAAADY